MFNITPTLDCGGRALALDRARVVGIVNVTPDSFSGDGLTTNAAIAHGLKLVEEGADALDIGGESTRPGADDVSVEEELRRVMPVIFALRDCGKPLSIDTTKSAVMVEAIAAVADMINDIGGFRERDVLHAFQDSDCALCIMHMQNAPATMQTRPRYQDVVTEVIEFLRERVAACHAAGITANRICVDPGFGFGKSVEHNVALLRALRTIYTELSLPVLAGLSRKSFIGHLTGRPVGERLAGSVAAAVIAANNGAAIVRVHDVAQTVDALKIWQGTRAEMSQ